MTSIPCFAFDSVIPATTTATLSTDHAFRVASKRAREEKKKRLNTNELSNTSNESDKKSDIFEIAWKAYDDNKKITIAIDSQFQYYHRNKNKTRLLCFFYHFDHSEFGPFFLLSNWTHISTLIHWQMDKKTKKNGVSLSFQLINNDIMSTLMVCPFAD